MTEREQFEAWVLKNWQTAHRENGRLTWHDSSVGAAIGHAWDGWQAARAQPAQAGHVPEASCGDIKAQQPQAEPKCECNATMDTFCEVCTEYRKWKQPQAKAAPTDTERAYLIGFADGKQAQQAEAVPEGYRIVPDWKGYALLGSGRYLINHAANYDPELGAELIITLATEKDREGGRKIGESRPNAEDLPPIQPDEMVIRIGFLNGDALFALEDQLAEVRKVLEAAGKAAPQQAEAVPPSFVLVPVEPTEAMLDAAQGSLRMEASIRNVWRDSRAKEYRAMIAAAQGDKT